jgi:dienelactone hydrolase
MKGVKNFLWILFIIVFILFFGFCHTTKDLGSITLVSFQSDFLEISGVAPAEWIEVSTGTFKQNDNTGDYTYLIYECYPEISAQMLITSTLIKLLHITQFPDSSETRETLTFQWRIYKSVPHQGEGLPDNLAIDMAIAEKGGNTYIVIAFAEGDEYNRMPGEVFYPALDALTPTPGTRAVSSKALFQENRHLFDYDPTLPLNIQKTNENKYYGYTEITLSYDSPKGGQVPTTLMVPDGSGPFPGMIIMHGMPSNRQSMFYWGKKYALAGVTTILIDAPFARPENRDRSEGALTYIAEIDRPEQIQLIVDLRRAIDLLTARPDINPNQLVYMGASYGGSMGGLLAGVEKRLKAFVFMVGDGGLVSHSCGIVSRFNESAAEAADPGLMAWREAMWPIEPIHYVGEAAPVALLFQNGTLDEAVFPPEAYRYQNAASTPKTILWYEAAHNLPLAGVEIDQAEWLRQFIDLN